MKPKGKQSQHPRNRGGGGGPLPKGGRGNTAFPNPEQKAFNTFLDGLPPVLSQWGLEKVFSGAKRNEKETMDIVDRLLRCLQSQKASTQRVRDSFVTLVILLQTNTHVKTDKVLDLINQIFVTDGDNTRGERRAVYAGKILGLGAIIRSYGKLDPKTLNRVIAELASLAEKRTSLLTLSTPFLCSIISEDYYKQEKQRKKIDFSPIQNLLQLTAKPQLAAVFRLSLAVADNQVQLDPPPLLASIDSIVDTVVGVVRHDDKNCLRFLFRYLNSQKKTKQFWKTFSSKLGAYHFDLLQTSISVALKNDCPLKNILRKSVIQPLLSLFKTGDEDMTKKVVAIFRQLLDWEKEGILSSKQRLAAIQLLFGELELSSEYRHLHSIFRRFLTFLTGEEIEALVSLCQGQSRLESRGANSTISLLAIIAPNRKTPLETKLTIAQELFQNGFCSAPEENQLPDNVGPEILVMRQRLSRTAFVSVLKHTYDAEFIQKMFSFVRKVATGKKDGLTLAKPASEQDLANFKVIYKLVKKMEDTDLRNCLQIYGIYSVADSPFATAGLDMLIPLCEKSITLERRDRAVDIITFILAAIEAELVIFDYEAIFGKLLIERNIHADAVQLLVKIIDVDMADALNDDDDESSDGGDEDMESLKTSESKGELKMNGNAFTPSSPADEGPDSDEESLDMDAVDESELNKMDAALANVFSTKKRVKAEKRLEEALTLRVLNLLGMLLRRYPSPDDGAIPLLILIPALTLLRKSGKAKRVDIHARVTDVVKRLNGIRHIGNAATFEPSLIHHSKEDIEGMLEKKLPRNVRQLINGSLEMLRRCFQQQMDVKEVRKRKKTPIEGGEAKRTRKRTLSNSSK